MYQPEIKRVTWFNRITSRSPLLIYLFSHHLFKIAGIHTTINEHLPLNVPPKLTLYYEFIFLCVCVYICNINLKIEKLIIIPSWKNSLKAMLNLAHLGFVDSSSDSESRSLISSSWWPHGLQSMEFSRPEYWSSSCFLLQGIFPTQGLNPGLPQCRWIL